MLRLTLTPCAELALFAFARSVEFGIDVIRVVVSEANIHFDDDNNGDDIKGDADVDNDADLDADDVTDLGAEDNADANSEVGRTGDADDDGNDESELRGCIACDCDFDADAAAELD